MDGWKYTVYLTAKTGAVIRGLILGILSGIQRCRPLSPSRVVSSCPRLVRASYKYAWGSWTTPRASVTSPTPMTSRAASNHDSRSNLTAASLVTSLVGIYVSFLQQLFVYYCFIYCHLYLNVQLI